MWILVAKSAAVQGHPCEQQPWLAQLQSMLFVFMNTGGYARKGSSHYAGGRDHDRKSAAVGR